MKSRPVGEVADVDRTCFDFAINSGRRSANDNWRNTSLYSENGIFAESIEEGYFNM